MHRRIVFALVSIGVGFITATFAADEKLAFHADTSGNLIFDTGIVKGALQKDGLGEGIQKIQFIGEDASFDMNHGLLCPYRFLTPQKRFGFGSWEWLRTGQIHDDGSAELSWDNASDRPFHFSQSYLWKTADTLDVMIQFTAETRLEKFELFLGSYLTNSIFNKAKVYVKDAGNGRAGFVEATKEKGYIQLFPKNSEALSIVNDGRWKFPPYPMDWRIRSALAAPMGIKQDPQSGATVIFMCPPQDCFALSMWQQEAKQGGFYLSMFGRDIAPGQKATAHVRLIFGKNISDAEAVRRYEAYLEEIKSDIDPSATNQMVATRKTDWISSEIPKPDADGWIKLFDGKRLSACPSAVTAAESGKLVLQTDGVLRVDSSNLQFNLAGSNVVIRARLKKIPGGNCGLHLRSGERSDYLAWFNGAKFAIGKVADGKYRDISAVYSGNKAGDFIEMELRAEGDTLTLLADGKKIGETSDSAFVKGTVGVNSLRGITLFKSIEVRILDSSATSHVKSVPAKKAGWISPQLPKPNADGWMTLFDGQHLSGCDPTDENVTSGKVFLKDGSLGLDGAQVHFKSNFHNAALRVRGKKISGRNITLSIGPYRGWFNGQYVCFGIHKTVNDKVTGNLAEKKAPNLPDFFDMEMTVIDGKISLKANGETVVTAQSDPIEGDASLNVWAVEGLSIFKSIEAKVLDASP